MNRPHPKPLFRIFTLFSLLAMLFSLLPVTAAYAAPALTCTPSIITVANNADSGTGSLRQAIANVCSGGAINFDNDYTITLASQLEIINKTITITGAGHRITISGNNAVRVFHVGQSGGSGNLTIDHLNIVNGKSTVEECAGSAVACGGGLMLEYLTTATVLNSTFSNNDGGMAGGAIYSYYGNPLTVSNSTFINNHATAYAGAIEAFYGSATLTNNTFWGNVSGAFGSTFLNTWGTVTLRNNIFVKGATSINACDSDFSDGGSTNDGGGNVRSGDNTCPGTTANPLLGALGDYGGGAMTAPILPGSPAINAASANCPAVDARGISRGATCDSGAFESQGFTLTKTGGDNQSTPINTAFAIPLAMSITSAFGEPADGGKITFTSPGSGASAAISGSPVTISGGAVSVNTTASGIVGGPYNVTASTAGATSVNFSLTNLKGNTTTSLTSAPNPSVVGQAVTFTATVTSVSGMPAGMVTFYDNTLNLGNGALNASGVATMTTTSLAVGTHPITATYSGDSNFAVSSGALSGGQVGSDTAITDLAAINSSPTRVTAATYFTATLSAGSNVTYQWDFDDGQTGSGAISSHIYTATGTYTATVIATNGSGSFHATTLVTIEPMKFYLPVVLRF